MDAPNSHADYEGLNGTPLQARIEATVTRGLGYSDRFDSYKSVFTPDVSSQFIGEDDPQLAKMTLKIQNFHFTS